MEGVGSRLGRASARYNPTQTVFNGPVRKWKKKWVHVPPSSSTTSKSNGHKDSGSSLLLCRWTPLSSNSSDNNEASPEEPPKRRFRYTPIVVLEEQKKVVEEKVEDDEAKESETNMFTDWSASEDQELNNVDAVLKKETQDSNTSNLDLGLCLKGHDDDHDSVGQGKEDQPMKSAFDNLF